MTRSITFLTIALAFGGCTMVSQMRSGNTSPYSNPPFYAKYLDMNNPADRQIQADLDTLRANPRNAAAHNDLGELLSRKGFPKDAEREFERAVNADSHFYPAWYNLGLIRSDRGDFNGARFAFSRAIHYKPGHPAALFQLGLIEEQRGHDAEATDYYAKAFLINRLLLDVKVNPRILDSKLVDVALLKAYPKEHNREASVYERTPAGYVVPTAASMPQAPSRQAPADAIVTPAPPVTDQGTQTPPPTNVPPLPPPPQR